MRLHKEGFDALAQIRIESITNNYSTLDPVLQSCIIDLCKKLSGKLVSEVLATNEFKCPRSEFTNVNNNRSKMRVSERYFSDACYFVSSKGREN